MNSSKNKYFGVYIKDALEPLALFVNLTNAEAWMDNERKIRKDQILEIQFFGEISYLFNRLIPCQS
jgi:hypothetical protein